MSYETPYLSPGFAADDNRNRLGTAVATSPEAVPCGEDHGGATWNLQVRSSGDTWYRVPRDRSAPAPMHLECAVYDLDIHSSRPSRTSSRNSSGHAGAAGRPRCESGH